MFSAYGALAHRQWLGVWADDYLHILAGCLMLPFLVSDYVPQLCCDRECADWRDLLKSEAFVRLSDSDPIAAFGFVFLSQ